MNILNIIDTIYESKYFPTILIISIIVLVFLFIAVILLGLKDAKKSKEPHKEQIQDLKDITFDAPTEKEAIKEDVTFEIPVLTKNLENFKKSLEEEIEREEKINVVKKTSNPKEEAKPTKILDKEKIDNTAVIPVIHIDSIEEPQKEKEEEEAPRPPKREILRELFKNHKPKEIVPPKVNGDQLEDQNNKQVNKSENKKVENSKNNIENKKMEQPKTQEHQKEEKVSAPIKKETKYSGDDDF